MKRKNKQRSNDYHNPDDLKLYMKMPAKEKLIWLEEMNSFLEKITPPSSKKIWEKLKAKGF